MGQQMHRCVGKHGEPTFSDKRCNDPSFAALHRRSASPGTTPADAYQTCLTQPEDLRDALTAALQNDQRVRLSGLLLWSSGSAGQGLQRLAGLAGEVLQALHLDVDDEAQPVIVVDSIIDPRGVPRARQTLFRMRAYRGCWWLTGG